MKKKLIFAIVVPPIGLLLSASPLAQASDKRLESCDAACIASQHPQAAKPAVPGMVCIPFVQPESGTVVLTLTFGDGEQRIYSRPKGPKDAFHIGRQWLQQSVRVELCNQTTGSAAYEGEDLAKLTRAPVCDEQLTACLSGADKCEAMSFKVKRE